MGNLEKNLSTMKGGIWGQEKTRKLFTYTFFSLYLLRNFPDKPFPIPLDVGHVQRKTKDKPGKLKP